MPDVKYSFPSGEVHGEEVGVVISDEDDVAVDIREEAEDVDDDAPSEEREEDEGDGDEGVGVGERDEEASDGDDSVGDDGRSRNVDEVEARVSEGSRHDLDTRDNHSPDRRVCSGRLSSLQVSPASSAFTTASDSGAANKAEYCRGVS